MENNRLETKSISARLPIDVVDTLNRWMEETGQSMAQCITNCVRVSIEDEKRITKGEVVIQGVLQNPDVIQDRAASVIQIPRPKNRDDLADAITFLQSETQGHIGERDQISALGVARARIYKQTPEFQVALADRQRRGVTGPYDDEKKLAERLSAEDAG